MNDGNVFGSLVLEDAAFRAPVGLIRAVPVEVVVRDVQQDGHGNAELVDPLQLEARQLGDDLGVGRERYERRAHVSRRDRVAAGRSQRGDRHLGRRRLAVRAGDADKRPHTKPEGELDLAPHRETAPARFLDPGRRPRNTRAGDDQLGVAEVGGVGAAENDASAGDAAGTLALPVAVRGVEHRHRRAGVEQRARGGLTRARQAEHDRLLPAERAHTGGPPFDRNSA